MAKVTEDTINQLFSLARKRKSTLLTGTHGVGKTEITKWIAEKLGIRYKYLSCATLDPWVDFVGLPIPDLKKKTLELLRFHDMALAEMLIMDEINRSHPKVQNGSLEIVQFGSINGVPLPRLKMIWGLQNPPTKMYQCTQLDPAMITRFRANITLTANPSAKYLASVFNKDIKILRTDSKELKEHKLAEKENNLKVAQALVEWWLQDLTDETREMVPPRILQYLGELICEKLDWQFALGNSLGVALWGLENRLIEHCGISKYEAITLLRMTDSLAEYMKKVNDERDFAIHTVSEAMKARPDICWDATEILISLPLEFQNKLLSDSKWNYKMLTHWPKLHKSFHDSDECKQLHKALKEVSGLDEEDEA